ncbi:MAG: hypothetical protein ACYCVD_10035 [Desulfitobacteriaceae bacterium]
MMKRFQLALGAFLTMVLLMVTPLPAFADTLLTQVGGTPLVVPEGHMVDSVLSLGTDARIAGTVKDVVFVINGDVYLEQNAQVDLVIDVGGSVHNALQKPTKTGIIELNFTLPIMNQLLLGGVMVIGFWIFRLMVSLIGIIALTGLGFVLRKHLKKSEELLASSAVRLFGIGTAIALVLIALVILLSLTMIGIPFAVLILLTSAVAVILGFVPVMEYLGQKVFSSHILEFPVLTRLLVESMLFVALMNLPLIGLIFLLGTGMTGLGMVVIRSWLYFKERKKSVQQ